MRLDYRSMLSKHHHFLLLLAGLIITSISMVLFIQPSMPGLSPTQQPSAWANHAIGYYYDQHGELALTIHTPALHYHEHTQCTTFSRPVIYVNSTKAAHWVIKAQQATAYHANHIVSLQGKVVIEQYHSHQLIRKLQTSQLEMNTLEKRAYSERSAVLDENNLHMTGTGVTADLNHGTIHIIHQATVTLEQAN